MCSQFELDSQKMYFLKKKTIKSWSLVISVYLFLFDFNCKIKLSFLLPLIYLTSSCMGLSVASSQHLTLFFCFIVQFHHSALRAQDVREGLNHLSLENAASTGVILKAATRCTQKAPTWRLTGGRTQVRDLMKVYVMYTAIAQMPLSKFDTMKNVLLTLMNINHCVMNSNYP